jgi:hypothetical protein
MFCRSFLVLLSFFFWILSCLFFFDWWIPITHLVFSNSSYEQISIHMHCQNNFITFYASYFPYATGNMVVNLATIMQRTANLIIFSHDLWIFEQCQKLEDNLIGNIENSVVVTTIYFWIDRGRNIYWFHWTLHEKGLFCRPYGKVNPVTHIIVDSK